MNSFDSHNSSRSLTRQRPTFIRYNVLIFLALASSSAYLTRYCIAVANTTIQEELEFTNEQMGWIFSAFSLGYFICQIPGGWLASQFGSRRAFSGISIAWSLMTVWTASVFSFLPMLFSRIAFGLTQAGLVPITAHIIKDWFPDNRRGFSSAVISAAMSVGGAITMTLTAKLLDIGWRTIFYAYSSVGIVWSIAFYWYFRTKPADHPGVNETELALINSTAERADQLIDDEKISAEPVGDVDNVASSGADVVINMLTSLSMWGICIQSVFRAAGYMLFVTWFPAFLEKGYGLTKESAGELTSSPIIAVVLGSLAGGFLVDQVLSRTGNRWLSRTGVSIVALGLCGCFSLASAWSTSPYQLVAAISIGAFFSGVGNPSAWAATMDIAGKYTSIVVGAMNMAGTIGGFVTPIVLGYLIGDIERTDGDWNQVIYLFAGIYFAGSLSWLLVDPNSSVTDSRSS